MPDIDKCRLHTRQHPYDPAALYIALEFLPGPPLDMQLRDNPIFNKRHPCLMGSRINNQFICHNYPNDIIFDYLKFG